MSDEKKKELAEAAVRASRRFNALDPQQKVERLKRIGILADDGQLSEQYGGPSRGQPGAVLPN